LLGISGEGFAARAAVIFFWCLSPKPHPKKAVKENILPVLDLDNAEPAEGRSTVYEVICTSRV
jgi:hypothetical protein